MNSVNIKSDHINKAHMLCALFKFNPGNTTYRIWKFIQGLISSNAQILSNPYINFIVWIGLFLISLLFFAVYRNFTQDDAFITYRYARNISDGIGFVYNPGEWVLGTTTPLFTLLLALGAIITKLDVVVVSTMICFLSLWLSAGFIYELGKSNSTIFGISTAIIYLTNPFLPHFVGMESFFLICLFLFTVVSYNRQKLLTTSISSGFLVLVRYEMIILILLFVIIEIIRNRKLPFWLLPGLIPVLIWVIYAWQVFGSPVPLSASAKLTSSSTPFLLGFAGYVYSFANRVPGLILIITLFLTGLGSMLVSRLLPRNFTLVLLFGSVYLVISAFVAGSFPWYYAPLIPLIAIFTSAGIHFLAKLPIYKPGQGGNLKRLISELLITVLTITAILIQASFWIKDYVSYEGQNFDHRHPAFTQASQWLSTHAGRDKSITALEIGYIGFYSDMRVVDLHALVTPQLFPWVGKGSERSLQKSLELFETDYVFIPVSKDPLVNIMSQDPRYRVAETFDDRYILFEKINN